MTTVFSPDAAGVVDASVENPKRVSITNKDGEIVKVVDTTEPVEFDADTLRVVVDLPGAHGITKTELPDLPKPKAHKKSKAKK